MCTDKVFADDSHFSLASGRRAVSVQTRERHLRRIEDVKVGDVVWAWDPSARRLAKRRVMRLYRRARRPILEVTFASAQGDIESVFATSEHPFWVDGKGWVAANNLFTGDVLRRIDRGPTLQVHAIRRTGQSHDVHNFEVEGVHSYFVGRAGVLVHNSSGKSQIPGLALPRRSTREYKHLIEDLKSQFNKTHSYAILVTSHLFTPDIGDFLVESTKGVENVRAEIVHTFSNRPGLGRAIKYKLSRDLNGQYVVEDVGSAKTRILERMRGWTQSLLTDAFGPELVDRLTIQGQYTNGYTRHQVWHADGGRTFTGTVATRGPGSDVVRQQSCLPPDHAVYGTLNFDELIGRTSPQDYIQVPTGNLLIMAAHGQLKSPAGYGLIPTVHRRPEYSVERFVLLMHTFSQ